jgi:eukaryotic-like serine/threonine-protein kinase
MSNRPSSPSMVYPGHTLLGRYRVDHQIGQGGYGVVFRAWDYKQKHEVALKVLDTARNVEQSSLERFYREARVARELTNEHTTRLLDVGQTEEGAPFIVWELLHGQPLNDVLENEGPFTEERVVSVSMQILNGLAEAHERGIVHRDIKGSNIFLCTANGKPDFVKILDFGVAKRIIPSGDGPELTLEGQMIGTPSCMAPEQVLAQDVAPYTDIFALGLLMSNLLTGEVVFCQTDNVQFYIDLASPIPAPLPAKVLEGPLRDVIVKATQKLPADRFQTASEMVEALHQALPKVRQAAQAQRALQKPVEQPVPGKHLLDNSDGQRLQPKPRQVAKKAKNNRWWYVALIVASVSLIGGIIANVVLLT